MNLTVIGADPGDIFGYGVVTNGKPVDSGNYVYKKPRMKKGEKYIPAHRWIKFTRWFEQFLCETQAKVQNGNGSKLIGLVYEKQIWAGGHKATDVMKGYETHLITVCAKVGIQTMPLNIKTLKKYGAGHGGATKEHMEYWLKRKMGAIGIKITKKLTDHEVDAIFAALWGYGNKNLFKNGSGDLAL